MSSIKEVRVVIVDDHPVFRRGLGMVIAADPVLKVVGEAGDGFGAVERIGELRPDVAVLDIDMPQKNGFDVVRELRSIGVQPAVIFLTMHRDEALFNGAFDLGAQGYLLKDSAISDIVAGVKAVAGGENFISPALSTFLINRTRRATTLVEHKPTLLDLTPTERRVLRLIVEDKQTREIADALGISPRTVENHRSHICRKLDLRGANALLKFALANRSKLL
jgi:DNA-binding NarL/FixJ family response regulator